MTLDVRNLRFAYRHQEVLRSVDLSAAEGELVCVLGANGAGKTTLFRAVLRLIDGFGGEVLLDGTDTRRLAVREIARRIAYVPQAYSPTFDYSVFETVLMGTHVLSGSIRGPLTRENEVAASMLDLLGIAHLADRGLGELSGGERQLVLIARALAQRSKMIVMDEPAANLDYGNQLRVMGEAHRLARQGYLVLLSTHSPQHALWFADRVVVLDKGVVQACGAPGTVLTPELIEAVYGVSVELQQMRTAWGAVPVLAPDLERVGPVVAHE